MSKAKFNYKRKHARHAQTNNLRDHTGKKFIKYCHDIFIELKKIRIDRKTFYEFMHKLSSRPAESGGILLGPVGTNDITNFVTIHRKFL